MIVDSPILTTLPVGTDRVIPQQGDNQVVIPSTILPVVEPRIPGISGGVGANISANQSLIVHSNFTKNNAAAGNSVIMQLPKGLYDIYMSLSGRFDYTVIGAVPDITISIVQGTFLNYLLGLYAAVGAQSISGRQRFLIITAATLRIDFTVTTVAQNMDVCAFTNVQRIL